MTIVMNEHDRLFFDTWMEAKEMLTALSIQLGEFEIEPSTRMKKYYGLCKYLNILEDGTKQCRITITDDLVKPEFKDELLNTIIHEMLHTVSDAVGHGKRWKEYAQMVYDAYGIRIRRTDDKEHCRNLKDYRFYLTCSNCFFIWKYNRSTRAVRYPDKCTCPYCKTKTIKRISYEDIGQRSQYEID